MQDCMVSINFYDIVQSHQAVEWFGFGALGLPLLLIHLDGFRSTTTVNGATSVMTLSLASLKLMLSAISWGTLEPPASPDNCLIGEKVTDVMLERMMMKH